MDANKNGTASVAAIAAAIGDRTRARMLYCLMDGRARTSTELSTIAEVAPSTASVHLQKLRTQDLVRLFAQGKHRYYSLNGTEVANALESLSALAGTPRSAFVPTTPIRLRTARTCYDHMAGTLGVSLYDGVKSRGWLRTSSMSGDGYDLTPAGKHSLSALGVDVDSILQSRRRLAYPCLDWSERRPHLGGAVAAAVLSITLKCGWIERDLDSRILTVTTPGRRELKKWFGIG